LIQFICITNKNDDSSDGFCAGRIRKQMVPVIEGTDFGSGGYTARFFRPEGDWRREETSDGEMKL